MKKLLALIAFSVLLLVPVGAQQVFANHPDVPTCPSPGGTLITDGMIPDQLGIVPFCQNNPVALIVGQAPCVSPYIADTVVDTFNGDNLYKACVAVPILSPDLTLAAQCQGAAVLVSNHCFAEALASMVGGILLSIDTTAVLVAAIGTDPVITGLVAITMAGIAGQAVWFIHRRKKKVLNL